MAMLLSACASQSAAPPPESPAAEATTTFAILPPQWMTAEATLQVDAAAAMVAGIEETGGVRLVASERAATALAAEPEGCIEDLDCVRRVGATAQADKAVVVRLAGLGETVLVRVSLVDVQQGTREQTRQEVVQGATGPLLVQTLQDLGAELARPFAPAPVVEAPTPWYRKWWVWTLIGGAAAAAATGVTLGIVLGGGGPDQVITPP